MADMIPSEVTPEIHNSNVVANPPATLESSGAVVAAEVSPATAVTGDSLAPTAPEIILHTTEKTLLGAVIGEGEVPALEVPKPEVKVEEVAKPEEVKTAEPIPEVTPPVEAPKPVIEYTPFTLPEGFSVDSKKMAETSEAFNSLGLNQEQAQSLIDLHTRTLQTYHENTLSEQHRAFGETRKSWQNQVMSDDQLGGSGHHTSMQAVARMRDKFVPAANRPAFDNFLEITGAGDHPEFLRLLHNVARAFDEPTPPAAQAKPVPQKSSTSRNQVLYDHPTSTNNK